MVTGVLALLVGGILLVARPDILATYHYNQYVIATTHLLVLGWISTIVMGAMYQLVPVALETRLYSERLARWQFAFHLIGFTGMVWMFWTWNMKQVGHFGTVLTVGVGLFVYNVARTLLRVPRWNVVASGVASALVWLCAAVTAGLMIVAGKSAYSLEGSPIPQGWVGALIDGLRAVGRVTGRFDQISAMHAHAHLGALGVFVMLILAISFKLVPMFALSEIQSHWRTRISLGLVNIGLLGSFFAVLLRSPLKIASAATVVCGLAVYGIEITAIVRARKRRHLDWGLRYFLTALVVLGLVSLLALALSWPGLPLTTLTGQLENLYGFLALIGVISFAIIGMLYKIVPFLVWYQSYSRKIGGFKVPSLADLYSHGLQQTGYWTYLAGLATASAGIVCSSAPVVRLGCCFILLSLLVLVANMLLILRHLVRPKTESLPLSSFAKAIL